MNIGEAAKAAGVNAKAIRYYESIGLLRSAARTGAGYRIYGEADVATVRFIRRARDFGMPVERIRVLVGLWQDRGRASAEVKAVALAHVAELDARIVELTAMSHALLHLAESCHGDARPECPILDDLAAGGRHVARQVRDGGLPSAAMNVALRTPMTVAEFLEWEQRQAVRHEFDGVRAIAMAGGRAAHAAIQANLIAALVTRLRGKACRAYGSELKIAVAGSIRYPDAFVVCTPVDRRAAVVTEQVVVFEVLSEASVNDDLVVKNAEYRATPSIQRYVVLQQAHAGATVFTRSGENWIGDVAAGANGRLAMPEIGIEVPLAEIYADVDLEPVAAA